MEAPSHNIQRPSIFAPSTRRQIPCTGVSGEFEEEADDEEEEEQEQEQEQEPDEEEGAVPPAVIGKPTISSEIL